MAINFRAARVLESTYFPGPRLTRVQANCGRPDNRQARGTLSFETSTIVKVCQLRAGFDTGGGGGGDGGGSGETGIKYES